MYYFVIFSRYSFKRERSRIGMQTFNQTIRQFGQIGIFQGCGKAQEQYRHRNDFKRK